MNIRPLSRISLLPLLCLVLLAGGFGCGDPSKIDCSGYTAPVCGLDGVTYQNDCAAEKAETWERLWRHVDSVLRGEATVETLLKARRRPVGRPEPPAPKPPSVSVSNEVSDFYTVVDVAANDRLGLLYDLARTIADAGLEIFVSKAGTVLDQVADTFYVKDREGHKLADPERLAALRDALLAVVRSPGGGADG